MAIEKKELKNPNQQKIDESKKKRMRVLIISGLVLASVVCGVAWGHIRSEQAKDKLETKSAQSSDDYSKTLEKYTKDINKRKKKKKETTTTTESSSTDRSSLKDESSSTESTVPSNDTVSSKSDTDDETENNSPSNNNLAESNPNQLPSTVAPTNTDQVERVNTNNQVSTTNQNSGTNSLTSGNETNNNQGNSVAGSPSVGNTNVNNGGNSSSDNFYYPAEKLTYSFVSPLNVTSPEQINQDFVEMNIKVKDSKGNKLSTTVKVLEKSTKENPVNKVELTSTLKDGRKVTSNFEITTANTKPKIMGIQSKVIENESVPDDVLLNGLLAYDNEDGDISSKLKVKSRPMNGTYTVSVEDSDNNTTERIIKYHLKK